MIRQTMDLPLEKLILTPEGCDIFDNLCIRIDVNQKYADLLPQWKDLAHQLQIDELVTKWVETCVRPREGLTRAVMEIYMKDGGTLGEVLEALLHLELLQILEETRPGLEKFIRMKVWMIYPLIKLISHSWNLCDIGCRRAHTQDYAGQWKLLLCHKDAPGCSWESRSLPRLVQICQWTEEWEPCERRDSGTNIGGSKCNRSIERWLAKVWLRTTPEEYFRNEKEGRHKRDMQDTRSICWRRCSGCRNGNSDF